MHDNARLSYIRPCADVLQVVSLVPLRCGRDFLTGSRTAVPLPPPRLQFLRELTTLRTGQVDRGGPLDGASSPVGCCTDMGVHPHFLIGVVLGMCAVPSVRMSSRGPLFRPAGRGANHAHSSEFLNRQSNTVNCYRFARGLWPYFWARKSSASFSNLRRSALATPCVRTRMPARIEASIHA